MYIAPWAKFRIPIMLKSKAKPNATNIYIDDNIRTLTTVIRVSCIHPSFFWLSHMTCKKLGGGISPPLIRSKIADLWNTNLYPFTETCLTIVQNLVGLGVRKGMPDSVGFLSAHMPSPIWGFNRIQFLPFVSDHSGVKTLGSLNGLYQSPDGIENLEMDGPLLPIGRQEPLLYFSHQRWCVRGPQHRT